MAKVNVEKAREHLTALLGVFAARYQLKEPYEGAGASAIQAAIKAGADADIPGLRAVLAEYNLYPHHLALAMAELKEAEAALAGPTPAEAEPAKAINRMGKAELVALAVKRGVTVEGGATVPELRAALSEEKADLEDEPDEPDAEPVVFAIEDQDEEEDDVFHTADDEESEEDE